ncbi:MAG TPA: hypothetical protein VLV83_22540, partial [Acidobacteriota bacterium]|nr:hypothetical protein [Acidobacteriota bacterium]
LPKNNTAANGSASTIQDAVVAYCTARGLPVTAGDVTVSQSETVSVGARQMGVSTITVSIDVDMITPGGTALAGGPVTVVGEAVFRNLY